jgi:Secretion system C-terminal sorting domain
MKSFFGIIFLLSAYPFFCFSQIYNTGHGEGFVMNCFEFEPPVVLPFTLLNAEAYCTSNTVSIKWSVASAVEGDVFIIERSGDGFGFEPAGQLRVTESKYTNHSYFLNDEYPVTGKSSYRIKYTRRDGVVFYSHTFSINCKSSNPVSIYIYPNPSYGSLNISSTQRIISFTIVGSSGQQVFHSKPNSQRAAFNIHHLIPGVYFTITETAAGFVYDKIVIAGQ